MHQSQVPVIDHYWQTETGFPICSNFLGFDGAPFPTKAGSCSFPVPGWNLHVVDEETGADIGTDMLGSLVVTLPLPPCAFNTLWRNKERFQQAYLRRFPGSYDTSDAGIIDSDGYVSVMARTDDIINVAGHRWVFHGLPPNSDVGSSGFWTWPKHFAGL